MTQSPRAHLLFIILCATAVRVVYFFQFQDNPFFSYVPKGWDQEIYYEGALSFARGDFLAVAPILDNHFSPAYQYFLGILFLIFGSELQIVWVAQLLLGVLSTLLVYSISCQLFSKTAGLLSALLFTFYAPNWLYEGSLYRASLIVFLELAAFRLLLALGNRPTRFLLISSALVLGLFMQIRSNNLLIFPVVFCYLWFRFKSLEKTKWPLLVSYVLLVVMVCTPALFWVKEVRGQWGLYDKSGPENLLLSNTLDHSVRTYEHNETYREVLKTIPLKTGPILKYVIKTFLDHPLEFLVLYLKKTYYYFNNYEIPVTQNFYLFMEFSPILGWGIPFVVIGALGILGGLLMWKREGWSLLHSFSLMTFFIFLPFLVLSRYRLYSVPFLCMFSGYSLVVFREWFLKENWKAIIFSLLCVLGLGLLFKTEPLPEGKIRIDDFANMGSIYLNNNKPEDDFKTLKYYRRAKELSSSLAKSLQKPITVGRLIHHYYYSQAIKLANGNEDLKALNHFETAVAHDYSVSRTHNTYARQLLKMGVMEGALREALEALGMEPGSTENHVLLGTIYSNLSYSPYWVVFHWEQALKKMEGKKHDTLSKTLIQIRDQLGLSDSMKSIARSEEDPILTSLISSISPMMEFSSDLVIPVRLENMSPKEINQYIIMLYQRLVLYPEVKTGAIHYQLGILYWKKENRLSAAVHHLEKARNLGRQFPKLSELQELHNANLSF
jgi:tetratricopeptide (TPR) repeat protein